MTGTKWFHGLVAAFVGGCAGALDSGLILILAAPETFNLNKGLRKTLLTIAAFAVLSGVKVAASYLRQSPVPPDWNGADRRNGNNGVAKAAVGVLALVLLAPAFVSAQQPQYALELGGAFYVSTIPHSAGYLTALIPVDPENKTRSYTTVEMRPVALDQVAYSTRTGIERTLYADSHASLNGFIQGGIATGASVTAGIFATGGNVAIPIRKGLAVVIGVEALASPAVGGWERQGRVGFRYTFGQ